MCYHIAGDPLHLKRQLCKMPNIFLVFAPIWENRAHCVYFGLYFSLYISTTKAKVTLLPQMAKRKVACVS
jgi:hypothetical protein